MAFQIDTGITVPKAVRRLARSQVRKAIEELSTAEGSNLDPAVHAARKRFKKLRALVRLCREGLGKRRTRLENHRFRDAGRLLSELRDADVLVATLDALVEQSPGVLADDLVHETRQMLLARKHEARERILESGESVQQVQTMMCHALREIKDWSFETSGWKALQGGLKKIYQDGIDAYDQAREDPTDDSLHDWRKRVKDLGAAFKLLRQLAPENLAVCAARAKELAEALGEDHDLAVLGQTLRDLDEVSAAAEAFQPLIDERRKQVRQHAFHVGAEVYDASPKQFLTAMRACWKARPARQAS